MEQAREDATLHSAPTEFGISQNSAPPFSELQQTLHNDAYRHLSQISSEQSRSYAFSSSPTSASGGDEALSIVMNITITREKLEKVHALSIAYIPMRFEQVQRAFNQLEDTFKRLQKNKNKLAELQEVKRKQEVALDEKELLEELKKNTSRPGTLSLLENDILIQDVIKTFPRASDIYKTICSASIDVRQLPQYQNLLSRFDEANLSELFKILARRQALANYYRDQEGSIDLNKQLDILRIREVRRMPDAEKLSQ